MDKDTFFQKKRLLNVGGNYLNLDVPKIAGILNVTPDSFYDGGRYTEKSQILKQVEKMLEEGADIIDVGACSSRPGAKQISVKEEYRRLTQALGVVREKWPEIIISVDTSRAEIAEKVITNFRVNMINDISGGLADEAMSDIIARYRVPYIIMHMRGKPETMQKNTIYTDLLAEITEFFSRQTDILIQKGINDILIDPGFGFSKTLEQNYQILYHLNIFQILNLPLMVGLSRKSMIYRQLKITPEEALNGTTALHVIALERGADILRVHDVLEAKQAIELYQKTMAEGRNYTLKDRE